ncbi:MAG: hypothetical protein ABIH99_05430 [Candidatus Micrarchaeota archaeon]
MATKEEEITLVKDWCEKRKLELARTPIIEPNPFKHISWMRNKTRIEIDRPREIADKYGVLYESTTRSLWEYMNGIWRRLG